MSKPRRILRTCIISERVQIRDVATVTLGPDPGDTTLRANGKTGIGLGIIRQAQSNTRWKYQRVCARLRNKFRDTARGVDIRVTSDDATFISGAIDEVVRSLLLAVMIVVIVIFLFLLDWRATLIPAVTMPIALIGTIAAIYLVGLLGEYPDAACARTCHRHGG